MNSKVTLVDRDRIIFPAARRRTKKKLALLASSHPLNLQQLPRWVLASPDPAFTSGAVLLAIDQIMRVDPLWLGCWRMRQALKASVTITRLLRLNADEADLRVLIA